MKLAEEGYEKNVVELSGRIERWWKQGTMKGKKAKEEVDQK